MLNFLGLASRAQMVQKKAQKLPRYLELVNVDG
jgi:hypothetical protein